MQGKIKQIAEDLASEIGLINVTKSEICKRAGIPTGSFTHVMGVNFAEFVKTVEAEGPAGSDVVKKRAYPELRKMSIINAALDLAVENGSYVSLTRDAIAERAGVSGALVSSYFGMDDLKNVVVITGITRGVPEIAAQALINRHPAADKISKELKEKAKAQI